jgi:hypothetical protein
MQAIPLALMAAGSIIQGVGGYRAGQYNKKVANANATAAEAEGNQRSDADPQPGPDRARPADRGAGRKRVRGRHRDGARQPDGKRDRAELDAMDAMYQARTKSNAYRSQGHLAAQEGNYKLLGGFVGAASSVASGMQDYATARSG